MLEKEKNIFHPISLADRGWINDKLKEDDLNACEYTFANNFIWAKVYDVQVGEIDGCGVIRYREHENYEYSFPFGNGDKKAAIELLKGICNAHNHELKLYPIVDKDRKQLLEWFPGEFEVDMDRSDFDYVYTVEKLSTLRGKKLHGKRNHIARFMDDNDWRYETMTRDNIDQCRKMAREWISMREEKWNDEMQQEIEVLEIAFSNFEELGFVGGVLYKQEKIVAFTIGERLNSDTMVVHFEKAYPSLQGAYPMINQQFVLHEAQDYTYVNREEDTGDLGLRKAKLSYYPDILLKKYGAKQSHVVFANENDREAIINIWQECFGDDRKYIEMYLDNRFETENMLVIHEAGRPVSMASFLPVEITVNGERISSKYVYAVATLPEYRKKGYASEIIKHAFEKYAEPLILQPESEKLVKYYEKLGFVKAFNESPCWMCDGKCSEISAAGYDLEQGMPQTLGKYKVSEASAEEYKSVRDRVFDREGYVQWDLKSLEYAIRENEFCGGKTLCLLDKASGEKADAGEIIMYRTEEDACKSKARLNIIETTLEDKDLYDLLQELMRYTDTSVAFAQNGGGMILLPDSLKDWKCMEGYLGLTLG
jgi:hypothetical protein